MNLSPRYLIKLLEVNGYVYKRSSGSHQIYYNPESKITVIVPFHGGRDKKKGTYQAIIKQAGIDKTI